MKVDVSQPPKLPTLDEEIKNILNYTHQISSYLIKEKRDIIIKLLNIFNAFDDWLRLLLFISHSEDFPKLRAFELFEEAAVDMENSIIQAIHGLYKPCIGSLRSCLEMSVLALYFQYDEKRLELDDWWEGKIDTPPFRKMREYLFEKENFKKFDAEYCLNDDLADLYRKLSAFVHNRGWMKWESYFRTPDNEKDIWIKNYVGYKGSFLIHLYKYMYEVFDICSVLFAIQYPLFIGWITKPKRFRNEEVKKILKLLSQKRKQQLSNYAKKYNISVG